jgi:HK97 gp10 family phage protein
VAKAYRTPHGGRVLIRSDEVLQMTDGQVEAAMKGTVETIANRVRLLQTGARTGRIYRIGKTPTKADKAAGRKFRSHQASAPGEPPAIWWATLFNSVRTKVEAVSRVGKLLWKGTVGTNVFYAPFLEFGTRRMKPRPLWRRAVLEVRGEIRDIWKRAAGKGPKVDQSRRPK